MRALIKRTFPEHGIIGEEFEADHADAEYVWVLDPIDGTKSFICGMPAWGTLIALTRRGEPIYGMMHQPFTREHFTGDGKGAHYRGPAGERALRVRPCAALGDAIMLTTSPLLMNERTGNVSAASKKRCGCRATAAIATPIACLPQATSISSSRPSSSRTMCWRLIPIIEGAGGIMTTWENGSPHKGGRIIAAGDKRVHAQAMKLLNG